MNIYDLVDEHLNFGDKSARIVAAILANLLDRKGIRQELEAIDTDTSTEMFFDLIKTIDAIL